MNRRFYLMIILMVFVLTGCRVDLYSTLPEVEANQMLAILMQHHIDAEKRHTESGVLLRVEDSHFINAVELMRLNGFPHRKYTTAEVMFPPNQLVISPTEEQQKILYLKEQRIEGMLSQMEGVLQADVAIASRSSESDSSVPPVSVAVFIKYSPQVNMEAFRMQIKNLVEKAIPGLEFSQIGILMQPTVFRVVSPSLSAYNDSKKGTVDWLTQHYRWLLMPSLILMLGALFYLVLMKRRLGLRR